jgi:HEAT repeat protein
MRKAAIQQLLRQDKAGAVPRATQLAQTDPDMSVRVAAIEALGASGTPAAVPALEKLYVDPTVETRQAVGRALLRFGGRQSAEAFERLAFTGPADGQRYAVMLLLMTVQRDDPLVQRLIKTHPDADIRDLAEHGLDVHEH